MTTSGSVLITGTSRGIGAATAALLRDEGFRVFAGVRTAEQASVARERGLVPAEMDITDADAVRATAGWIAAEVGDTGLRAVVNNAGIVVAGPLEFLPLDRLRRQLETGVVGPLAVTQAFLPLLRRGGGRVINIGSISGRLPAPFIGAYGATKSAVEGLSDALRLELRHWAIPVIVVQPGAIATDMSSRLRDDIDKIIDELPPDGRRLYGDLFGRCGRTLADNHARGASTPESVARAVLAAITARRPRIRYRVGAHAGALAAVARVLPDRVLDRIILRFLR